MARFRRPHTNTRLDPGSGWSLIELLPATLLLVVALLAAAPLFMRAVRDIRTGASRSAASVLAQNGLEALGPASTTGAATRASDPEYYSFEERRWLAAPPASPDRALWVRRTRVRRYPLSALADGRIEPGESAPPADDRPRVALLGVEVRVSRKLGSRPIAIVERLEWTVE